MPRCKRGNMTKATLFAVTPTFWFARFQQIAVVNFELPSTDIGAALKPREVVDQLEKFIVGQVERKNLQGEGKLAKKKKRHYEGVCCSKYLFIIRLQSALHQAT